MQSAVNENWWAGHNPEISALALLYLWVTNQGISVLNSSMLSPFQPETSTNATVSGLQPIFLMQVLTLLMISSLSLWLKQQLSGIHFTNTNNQLFHNQHVSHRGLPWWLSKRRICLQCRTPEFDFWVGKIPWRSDQQPTPVFLSAEFHGQRTLAGFMGLQRAGHD